MAERWLKGRLLNIGCGHGPDFIPFKETFELYGVDFSIEMLRLAQRYARKFNFHPHLTLSDVCYLPFRNEMFDYAVSVATYHHLNDKLERLMAFRELERVLKPGGEAFITVWNHWQPRFWFKRHEIMVPWKTKETALYRYYYLFSYGELGQLVRQCGLDILKSFPESSYNFPFKFFSRNICLLVKKSLK